MDKNIETVNQLYQAFQRGDVGFILDGLASVEGADVVADASKRAPWHFRFSGRDGAARYFEALLGALEPVHFSWSDLASSGDWVYATVQQEYKVRASGRTLRMRDGVHRFRLRDGKVLEWHAHDDTALVGEVLGL
jgi:ketosteroid isomerase-like protein